MERKRRKGSRLTDCKKNIIAALIGEYDIHSAEDIRCFERSPWWHYPRNA